METRTIVHDGGLCVEVSEPRYGDSRRYMAIGGKLAQFSLIEPDKPADAYALMLEKDLVEFAHAVSQVRSHSGFELPSPLDTPERIYETFQQLDELPAKFVQDWFEAAQLLRGPKGDPELAPPDMLTDEQKKIPESKPSASPSGKGSGKPPKNG